MGMAASQVRLLALTSRKHDIGRELEILANDKQALTREMQKVSRKYRDALSQTVLMWSNNNGIDYVPLTYSTLMRPNAANGNKPVLVTNCDGKIVIDSKYAKYAEMISPDGKMGGDWAGNRIEILSEVTGISKETLEKAAKSKQDVDDSGAAYSAALEAEEEAEREAIARVSQQGFARYWGNVGGHDFKKTTGTISLGDQAIAAIRLQSYLDEIVSNMSAYLPEDDQKKLKKACDTFYQINSSLITDYDIKNTKESVASKTLPIEGDDDNFKLNVEKLIDGIMSAYKEAGGTQFTDKNGRTVYMVAEDGIDSDSYRAYLAAKENTASALDEYETNVDTDNQVLTADLENKINFYDQLFTAIAESGWVEDDRVADPEYFNQMYQNNEFYVTTMTKHEDDGACCCDANNEFFKNVNEYDYSTDLWSNTENIFAVNNEQIRQEALVEYEEEKSKINEKESRVDIRMQNLETEQSAIKTMIQGIEQVRNNNVETNFSVFS